MNTDETDLNLEAPIHTRGISPLFIRRPITTTLVMVGIVLFGLISYRALPVSDLPAVDYPTINVNASLPGANPETMASSVATPLERQFSGIAGIDSINHLAGNYLVDIHDMVATVFAYATATHYKASATKGTTREFVGTYVRPGSSPSRVFKNTKMIMRDPAHLSGSVSKITTNKIS